jgi:hypothetical protein
MEMWYARSSPDWAVCDRASSITTDSPDAFSAAARVSPTTPAPTIATSQVIETGAGVAMSEVFTEVFTVPFAGEFETARSKAIQSITVFIQSLINKLLKHLVISTIVTKPSGNF